MLQFEWDTAKAISNHKKHGISFEEAQSEIEPRFVMLGMSNQARLLMVCHCEQVDGAVIRIISARKATRTEIGFYPERK